MTFEDWNVLIVEDEADSMDLVQTIFQYHGISFLSAADAEAALTLLAETVPTLIVIDLALPGLTGWELLSEIRQMPRLADIPCVAITAFHSTGMDDDVLAAGFDAYFPKPLNAGSFIEELEQLMP